MTAVRLARGLVLDERTLSRKFDPAEKRDFHGRWGSGGPSIAAAPASPVRASSAPAPLAVPGMTLPAGGAVRARIDDKLGQATSYTRGAKAGQAKRPACPPYAECVQRMAADVLGNIAEQGTMEDGRRWYPEEHALAERRAKAYHVSVAQAAGVVSATSPRCSYAISQRVTDEILDAAPKMKDPSWLGHAGGGVMGAFRDDGLRIAMGEDIGKTLGGAKRRSFYSNIMWPGKTDAVTVDTWMMDAMMSLGMTKDQAGELAREKSKDAPAGLGMMLTADAVRAAAKQRGMAPDEIQAAYWIALQKKAGLPNPSAHEGRTNRGDSHIVHG